MTDPNTAPLDLDGLERLASAGTKGPWDACEYLAGDCWQIQFGDRGNWLAEVVIDGDHDGARADAALIVAAVNALPALIFQAREAARMRGATDDRLIKAQAEQWTRFQTAALATASRALLDACMLADANGDLDEEVDGSLMDAVSDALERTQEALAPATGGGDA